MRPGESMPLEGRRFLRAYATEHIPEPDTGRARSLGYQIGRTVDRVRAELRGLPQAELDALRKEGGREAITQPEEEILLTVSGDTRVLPAAAVRGTRFLLHECTFLDTDQDRLSEAAERGHEHACLGDVLAMAAEAGVAHLALYHVSKRYSDEEIVRGVRTECARQEIRYKVSVALPGRLYYDLFSQTVWPGS
jgi:ribonuclease BN (tRNA processing enzyme)